MKHKPTPKTFTNSELRAVQHHQITFFYNLFINWYKCCRQNFLTKYFNKNLKIIFFIGINILIIIAKYFFQILKKS